MKTLPVKFSTVIATALAVTLFSTDAFAERSIARRNMIGQMLMMGFSGSNPNSSWPKRLAKQIAHGQVGGVVMLGYNFKSKANVKGLTALFRKAAGPRKIFIALDMEGGAVQRLGRKLGYPSIPSAGSTAKSRSPKQAFTTFSALARITRDAGFNMNLGPVVDLLITRKNPVIGRWNRSYGNDPAKVAAYARVFIAAHKKYGVATVLKHFPGHGSSLSDSHDGFVDITTTWRKKELAPFAELIAKGDAMAIMPGHLVHRRIATEGGPVSLSRAAITGLLRKKLGFRGLIISDDLQMGAIASNYSYATAVIRSINAGVDVLMISNSRRPDKDLPRKTIDIVIKAIDAGKISLNTIKRAYYRIVRAKTLINR